jgi:hypothetical protein
VERGAEGTSLYDGAVIIRMWYKTSIVGASASGALAAAFRLSSRDKQQNPPYLSMFEQSLTTDQQAKEITGKDLALPLFVSEVRSLVNPDYPDHTLDVCWFQATILQETESVPDHRPGTEGHCGIIGLLRPSEFPKKRWKWFCVKLADIAFCNNPRPVP